MARPRRSRPSRQNAAGRADYWELSRRPLQILAFLLPLVIAYELCLALLLRLEAQDQVVTISAHKTILQAFEWFGLAPLGGCYLGGIVIIVVLLIWHVFNRDPWRINYPALASMAIESLLLVFPLLAIGQVIRMLAPVSLTALATAGASGFPQGLGLPAELALSVGAGLYEELVFRMLLIAVIHAILVDFGRASHNLGAVIAVLVSAAAFAWYHPLNGVADLAFYFLAGLYFGSIYVIRGFGIVVAAHIVYDILAFTLFGPPKTI